MNPERWQQIQTILDEAWARGPAQWAAYLDRACADDPSLRPEVESLLASLEAAGNFMEEPIHDDDGSLLGQSIGAYRIVEELGRGGMGAVYRAVRAGDYEQQVAIKLIKRGFDTDFVLRRFRDERQILARLQHPGIARLLDGGSTSDGRPYFVMECIEGQPLDRYCDDHRLSIAERLRLFLSVCSAVEYAHQNLIVHRDIKPGNILVTADGTAKLLDFGIAKLVHQDSTGPTATQTATAMKLMTPEYASPEQAAGGAVTTASDVYSLGVVLYLLLTGRLPQRQAGGEIESPSAVIAGNPEAVTKTGEASLEKLRRRLSGDLDNIAMMALRAEPERRYSSVENLSEDIRRHLDALPISATRDTWRYRAQKFVRRHTTAVAAAALMVLVVLVGAGAVVWEAHVARMERARAERRFNDVRQLAHELMFDIYDGVKDLAGATKARKQILDSALRYVDSLTREASGDAALQRELASAYQRLGEVRYHPSMANLGDTAGALETYRKALALRETVARISPENLDDQLGLARAHYLVARISGTSGKPTEALENGQRAVAILEALREKYPQNDKVLVSLQSSYDALGDALSSDAGGGGLGRITEAAEVHRKALVLAEGRAQKYPRALAVCLIKVGNDYKKLGDRKAALAAYYKSRDIIEKLAVDATKAEQRRDVAGIASAIGDTLVVDGDGPGALAAYQKCTRITEALAAADPADQECQMNLGQAYQGTGDAYYVIGDWNAAENWLGKAREVIDRVCRHDPANRDSQDILAALNIQIGQVDEKTGRAADALQLYRAALGIFLASAGRDPNNVDARLNSSAAYLRIANALAKTQSPAAAVESYRQALSIVAPLASKDHADENALYTAADAYTGWGQVIMAMNAGEPPATRVRALNEARDLLTHSVAIWRRIPHPAKLTPFGCDAGSPKDADAALAKCEALLSEASRHGS